MNTLSSAVNLLQLLGEPTRVRLMALLADRELTVAELTAITELGQSTVSTHLGKLREAGLLRDRKAGASTFYAANDGTMPRDAKRLWEVLQADLKDGVLDADRERCDAVLRARERSAVWPDPLAGEMERHYSPGRTWESLAHGLIGLLRLGDVLDVGAGDGTIAQLVAPRAKSVTCLDVSEKMVDAARARLANVANVRCAVGDAHELPFKAAAFDAVLLFNVLTHLETPARVLAEAARVLRDGGVLAVVTLDAHEHMDATAAYRHVHPGISPAALKKLLRKAGFTVEQCDVTSREKRPPHFQIVTAYATKG